MCCGSTHIRSECKNSLLYKSKGKGKSHSVPCVLSMGSADPLRHASTCGCRHTSKRGCRKVNKEVWAHRHCAPLEGHGWGSSCQLLVGALDFTPHLPRPACRDSLMVRSGTETAILSEPGPTFLSCNTRLRHCSKGDNANAALPCTHDRFDGCDYFRGALLCRLHVQSLGPIMGETCGDTFRRGTRAVNG